MYNFIFWVVYSSNYKGKGNLLSRNNASGVVFITVIFHLGLLLGVIKKYINNNITMNIPYNSIIIMLILILGMASIFLYYSKKRIDKIMNKYSNNTRSKIVNMGIVLSVILIPLILQIIIGWKE